VPSHPFRLRRQIPFLRVQVADEARFDFTAERGDIAFREPPEIWLDDVADPIDVAEGLYEASSTLHLFATAKAKKAKANESRCIIVGDDSWKKWPVLMSKLLSLLCSAVRARSRGRGAPLARAASRWGRTRRGNA
jgi:hypothetical protein